MDQISVDFPHFRAICDSAEYYSMYIIVLDLMLYSEPLEKVRNERLEKIMLTSDFSDLRGAPEAVFKLQARIRQLEEIKEYFQISSQWGSRWRSRSLGEREFPVDDRVFASSTPFFDVKLDDGGPDDHSRVPSREDHIRWTTACPPIESAKWPGRSGKP